MLYAHGMGCRRAEGSWNHLVYGGANWIKIHIWGNVNMLIVEMVSVYISFFDKLCEMPGNERNGHINKTTGFCCPQPFKSTVTSSFVW
jgi:hypothetical protein